MLNQNVSLGNKGKIALVLVLYNGLFHNPVSYIGSCIFQSA